MTRCLLFAAVAFVVSSPARHAEYRDCEELFIAPLTAELPERKPNGNVWDEGPPVDPQVSVKPKDRADIGFKVMP